MSASARTRLLELLADRALDALSRAEEAELAQLLAEHPEVNPHALDFAAAMVAATDPEQPVESLPEELRCRIEAQALSMPPFNEQGMPTAVKRTARPWLLRQAAPWAGWAVAAGLLVAIGVHWLVDRKPSLTQRFERFRADAGAWVRADGGAPDPKAKPEVAGEIYWSASRQEGYMKLRGLPVNDPKEKQYQLWIFDKQRDERHPVDGGVFNIDAAGDVVIPIDARIPVRSASLFVITREPPGGVVVSDRKDIVMVAAVK
jgi:anti-sigma-K factor RskA